MWGRAGRSFSCLARPDCGSGFRRPAGGRAGNGRRGSSRARPSQGLSERGQGCWPTSPSTAKAQLGHSRSCPLPSRTETAHVVRWMLCVGRRMLDVGCWMSDVGWARGPLDWRHFRQSAPQEQRAGSRLLAGQPADSLRPISCCASSKSRNLAHSEMGAANEMEIRGIGDSCGAWKLRASQCGPLVRRHATGSRIGGTRTNSKLGTFEAEAGGARNSASCRAHDALAQGGRAARAGGSALSLAPFAWPIWRTGERANVCGPESGRWDDFCSGPTVAYEQAAGARCRNSRAPT